MDKETIVLDDSDDEPLFKQPRGGDCVRCGMVNKPHVCSITAGGQVKLMKRPQRAHKPSEASKRSTASAQLYAQLFGEDSEDEEDKPLASRSKRIKTSHAPQSTVPSKPDPGPPQTMVIPGPSSDSSSSTIPEGTGASALEAVLRDHSQLKTDHAKAVTSLAHLQAAHTQILAQQRATQTELTNTKVELRKAQASSQLASMAESAARQAEAKAKGEVARLQQVETALKKKAAAAGKAKGKAPVAAAAVSGAPVARDIYIKLIAETIKQYEEKAMALKKKQQQVLGQPVTRVIQTNTNPSYGTARDIAFQPTPSSDAAFYFDCGLAPHNPNWCKITDATVQSQLFTLGVTSTDAAGTVQSWVPTVGNACTYSFGSHSYRVHVQSVQPPPVNAPPEPDPNQWHKDMLFGGRFTALKASYLDQLLQKHDFIQDDKIEKGSKEVAALATLFSSFGRKFEYDPLVSELWLKPDWLKLWLRVAKQRNYNEARVLMHGMRTGQYQQLGKDVSGFDFNFSKEGARKWGFYGSCSDAIASHYNKESRTQTDGTAVIGLLLIKPNAGEGAYEHYNLGSTLGLSNDKTILDAYAVRDQLLWLPLGLAIAKPKI